MVELHCAIQKLSGLTASTNKILKGKSTGNIYERVLFTGCSKWTFARWECAIKMTCTKKNQIAFPRIWTWAEVSICCELDHVYESRLKLYHYAFLIKEQWSTTLRDQSQTAGAETDKLHSDGRWPIWLSAFKSFYTCPIPRRHWSKRGKTFCRMQKDFSRSTFLAEKFIFSN